MPCPTKLARFIKLDGNWAVGHQRTGRSGKRHRRRLLSQDLLIWLAQVNGDFATGLTYCQRILEVAEEFLHAAQKREIVQGIGGDAEPLVRFNIVALNIG